MSKNINTKMEEMVEINVNMSKSKRMFPRAVEQLLPLRTSFRDYKMDAGRILVSEQNLETSMDDSEGVTMYTLACQIGIIGHGHMIQTTDKDVVVSTSLCICESVIADVNPNMMSSAIARTYRPHLKWIIGEDPSNVYPTQPSTEMMYRSAMCYATNSPLTVYNNLAVLEAQGHSSNSPFWTSLYEPLEAVERHYSTPGIIYDNILLSVGASAGSDDSADIKTRTPSKDTGGFLDVIVTPQSKAAGRVRLLAAPVSIRTMTKRTIQLTCDLLSVFSSTFGFGLGDWVVRCMGFCCRATLTDVKKIVSRWVKMNERNMPTLHVFLEAKVLVISVSSGTLIRPMRMHVIDNRIVYEGPYVDTMCVYHSDTLRFANLSFPSRELEPKQYMNSITLMYAPFSAFTTEPRCNLAAQMALQALNSMVVQGDATLKSMGEQEPLVVSDFLHAVRSSCTSEETISLPNKYVVTAFINRTLNMEDACSIMEEYADSGHFSWMGEINYPLPSDSGLVKPGTILENQPWWKPNLMGIVTRVGMSKIGEPYAVVLVGSKKLEIGDKLATLAGGLKFTVGEKIPYRDMCTLVDTETGDTFKPNLLLSTKNVTRGLGGTVREMYACTSLFDTVNSFRCMQKPKGKRVYSPDDEKSVPSTLRRAKIYMNGKPLTFRDSNGEMRTVECSYGILAILQLRHISSLKQHYPSTITRSLTTKRGRYRGGTPRVGETDLLSILMQGLNVLAKECVVTTDLANFTICSGCNALPDFCDCPVPKPVVREIACRWSAVQACVFLTLGMLNDRRSPPMTLRFVTSS